MWGKSQNIIPAPGRRSSPRICHTFVMTAPGTNGQGERRRPWPGYATLLLEDADARTDPSRIQRPLHRGGADHDLDPAARRLRILNQDVVLAPTLPFANLEPGLVIYVEGYQDPTSGQRIATRLLRE